MTGCKYEMLSLAVLLKGLQLGYAQYIPFGLQQPPTLGSLTNNEEPWELQSSLLWRVRLLLACFPEKGSSLLP